MEFNVKKGIYQKTNNSVSKMMNHILISLIPFIIFSFYKNGIIPFSKNLTDVIGLFRPLIIVFIAILTGLITEYLWYKLVYKDPINLKSLFTKEYAYIDALLLSLLLPINIPLYLVAIATLLSYVLARLSEGGFTNNKINASIFGALFVGLICNGLVYLNDYEQTLYEVTPLINLCNHNFVGTNLTLINEFGGVTKFILGIIPGFLGTTGIILPLIALIYLIVNRVIKWRMCLYYLITMIISFLIIGISNNMGIWYLILNLTSGGLLFLGIYFSTDNTTTVSKFGERISGLILVILTLIFRFFFKTELDILMAIITLNLLKPLIENLVIKFNHNKTYQILTIISLILIIIILLFIILIRIS